MFSSKRFLSGLLTVAAALAVSGGAAMAQAYVSGGYLGPGAGGVEGRVLVLPRQDQGPRVIVLDPGRYVPERNPITPRTYIRQRGFTIPDPGAERAERDPSLPYFGHSGANANFHTPQHGLSQDSRSPQYYYHRYPRYQYRFTNPRYDPYRYSRPRFYERFHYPRRYYPDYYRDYRYNRFGPQRSYEPYRGSGGVWFGYRF